MRCLGIGHIGTPVEKPLLDAQRVKRLAAGKAQAKRPACFENGFQNMLRKIGRDKNLPAGFAGE